ncbi:MAG: spermine synthase [Lysobacterales bacterium]
MLPQSILLGMTFPILGAACVHGRTASDSSVLGSLYFSNSIGAAFGALVATFILVPLYGSPGALHIAGLLNLLVGAAAMLYALALRRAPVPAVDKPMPVASTEHTATPVPGLLRMMYLAAAITGASSFVYEIGWVRLLNLAMGSTQHSFELMLSAFILGLALGGLTIRRLGRTRIRDTVRAAGLAQIAMGVATLLSMVLYARSFEFVQWLMEATRPGTAGYSLYLFGSASLAMVTVFPAAFFAGMTLPLMTASVLEAGHASDKIGKVYAANTLGAIIGVFLTIHVLIPLIGVRLSLGLAGLIDVFLGVVLVRLYSQRPHRALYLACLLITLVAAALAQTAGRVPANALASGVFRGGRADLAQTGFVASYLRDGKTATVSLADAENGLRTIATNGKVDAGVQMDESKPTSVDEVTMRMAAGLPLSARRWFDKVAVIGFGSGLTTHTLLLSEQVGSVDTIEIEAEMIRAARAFGKHNARAYQDPRSHLVVNDARTWFAIGNKQYDLIVAEPSNPWVSGVASLFTTQFYDEVAHHLKPDGLMVQWLQAYELSDALLATMIAAVLEKFDHVDAFLTNSSDVLLVARQEAGAFPLFQSEWRGASLLADLRRDGIADAEAYKARWIIGTEGLRAYQLMFQASPHSDFYPVVSLNAPESRFTKRSADALLGLAESPLPIQQMLGLRPELTGTGDLIAVGDSGKPNGKYLAVDRWLRAQSLAKALTQGRLNAEVLDGGAIYPILASLFALSEGCQSGPELSLWIDTLIEVGSATLPILSPGQGQSLFAADGWLRCEDRQGEQHRWLELMRAIGERNPKAMEQLAKGLAASGSTASPEAKRYLVTTLMLARLVQGNHVGVESAETDLGITVGPESWLHRLRGFLLALSDLREGAAQAAPATGGESPGQ